MLIVTEEILEKARNSNTCPFCDGSLYVIEEIDDSASKVACMRCGMSWTETYDDEGKLLHIEENEDD